MTLHEYLEKHPPKKITCALCAGDRWLVDRFCPECKGEGEVDEPLHSGHITKQLPYFDPEMRKLNKKFIANKRRAIVAFDEKIQYLQWAQNVKPSEETKTLIADWKEAQKFALEL